MKSIIRSLLAATGVAMVLGVVASAQAANGNLVKDSNGYYKIDDYADLRAFANRVNGGSYLLCGKLAADITAEGTDWIPIGNASYQFEGVFDGEGHTITGLDNIGTSPAPRYAGLFGAVGSAGVVRNVGVVDGHFQADATDGEAGGIAGHCYGIVENCFSSGKVTGGNCAGGIAGRLFGGAVRNCHSTGSFIGNKAGGIVGDIYGTIEACYYPGYMYEGPQYFGAIVGYANHSTISHSYYDNQKASPAIGGQYDTTVSHVDGLMTEHFTIPGYFEGFDFENVWYMGDFGPMLRVFLDEYPYADPTDEETPEKTVACIPVTGTTTTLHSQWYVANSIVEVSERITVDGDANLILGDGCVLITRGGINLAASNSLTIWCQSVGSGTLVAYGREDDAAIGGGGYHWDIGSAFPTYAQSGGTLTVHGGMVTATARGAGAGIGGGGVGSNGFGDAGDGGTARIYGGTVRALSEGEGAGIGGGGLSDVSLDEGGKGGTVIIAGGTVTAGSEDAAAIGSGKRSGDDADGALFFAGSLGVVAATTESHLASAQLVASAGRVAACHSYKWAKVSPCQEDHGSLAVPCPVCGLFSLVPYIDPTDLAVPAPEKTRTGCIGVFDETEGLASGWHVVAGSVTLTNRLLIDGEVNLILADSAMMTAGQGVRVADGDSLTIWGQSGRSGRLVAVNDGGAAAIGGDKGQGGGAIAINGGTVEASTGDSGAQAIGGGNNSPESGSLTIGGGTSAYGSVAATEPVAAEDRTDACHGGQVRLAPCAAHDFLPNGVCRYCNGNGPVSYLDPTEPGSPIPMVSAYTLLSNQTALANDWYVVREDARIGTRIGVSGNVNLILCDGVELTAVNGFHVSGTNNLTVWAQSDNAATAGKLTVQGAPDYAAGIGGNTRETGGTVTENGGVLSVTGGDGGAGIGGGRDAAGGTISINSGTVTATGGHGGAGIGGGLYGPGGTITISGGTVTAIGGDESAGIGSGAYGPGGTITISSGTVMAVAGREAQAIGRGRGDNAEGSLALDGMRVFANAGAEEPVAAASREGTCRGDWTKVEVCPHVYEKNICRWCDDVRPSPDYATWVSENGVAGAWNAKDADGIANVFRYLFDEATGDFTNSPLLSLEFDAEGQLVARTPQLVNTNGFSCVLSAADEPGWADPTSHSLSPTGETPLPDEPPAGSKTRFFRLQATPERGGAAQ